MIFKHWNFLPVHLEVAQNLNKIEIYIKEPSKKIYIKEK